MADDGGEWNCKILQQNRRKIGLAAFQLKKHLEEEFEEKENRQIYWDDVAMFCHPQEYQLGIRKMQAGDIIEVDNLSELAMLDSSYKKYLGGNSDEERQ